MMKRNSNHSSCHTSLMPGYKYKHKYPAQCTARANSASTNNAGMAGIDSGCRTNLKIPGIVRCSSESVAVLRNKNLLAYAYK